MVFSCELLALFQSIEKNGVICKTRDKRVEEVGTETMTDCRSESVLKEQVVPRQMLVCYESILTAESSAFCGCLTTFRRKNALSDIGRVTLHATDMAFLVDFARVHSRVRGEWTVPA